MMAKQPIKQQQSSKDQDLADELREDIQTAYSFIEAQRFNQSIATFTIEDAMDQFVERISGQGPPGSKTNEIARIKNTVARVESAVARIKALPPSTFRKPNTNTDVNTPK